MLLCVLSSTHPGQEGLGGVWRRVWDRSRSCCGWGCRGPLSADTLRGQALHLKVSLSRAGSPNRQTESRLGAPLEEGTPTKYILHQKK